MSMRVRVENIEMTCVAKLCSVSPSKAMIPFSNAIACITLRRNKLVQVDVEGAYPEWHIQYMWKMNACHESIFPFPIT